MSLTGRNDIYLTIYVSLCLSVPMHASIELTSYPLFSKLAMSLPIHLSVYGGMSTGLYGGTHPCMHACLKFLQLTFAAGVSRLLCCHRARAKASWSKGLVQSRPDAKPELLGCGFRGLQLWVPCPGSSIPMYPQTSGIRDPKSCPKALLFSTAEFHVLAPWLCLNTDWSRKDNVQ